MLTEYRSKRFRYFLNKGAHYHGEFTEWHPNGQLMTRKLYNNGVRHGEHIQWYGNGRLWRHCFYVNGEEVSFKQIPYPKTQKARMIFLLKHDIPLLPVEAKC